MRTDGRIRPGEDADLRAPIQPRNNKRKIRLFRESSGRGFRDCTAACTRARRSMAPAPSDPTASLLVVCRLDLLCVLCVLCGLSLLISTTEDTEDTEDTEKPQRTRGTGATPHPVDPKHFLFLFCVACSPRSSSPSSAVSPCAVRNENGISAGMVDPDTRHAYPTKPEDPKMLGSLRDAALAPVRGRCAVIRL